MSQVKFCTAFDVTQDRCTVVEVFDTREDAESACAGCEQEIQVFEISCGPEGLGVLPGVRAFIGGLTGTVWA